MLTRMLYGTIKPFLHERARSKVQFLGPDAPELFDQIPREQVPREYGGSAPTLEGEAGLMKFPDGYE